jgi:5-methylcytosine-specific restriction endonuclease McrA
MSIVGTCWGFTGAPETPLQKLLMICLGDCAGADGWTAYLPEKWAAFCRAEVVDVLEACDWLEQNDYLTIHEHGVRLGLPGVDHASSSDCHWAPEPPPPPGRRSLNVSMRRTILERDRHTCAYCGDTTGPFQIDHIHPVSRGGTNDPDNLACACRTCNLSKRAMTVAEWKGVQ